MNCCFCLYSAINFFRKICTKEPVEVELPFIDYTFKLWRYWMTQEKVKYGKHFGNGKQLNALIESGKKLIGKSKLTIGAIYILYNEMFPKENEEMCREMTTKLYTKLSVCDYFFLSKLNWNF